MSELIYTTDKPSEPGWYWVRQDGEDDIIMEIDEIMPGEWRAWQSVKAVDGGGGPFYPLGHFTHFAGPIPKAKEAPNA